MNNYTQSCLALCVAFGAGSTFGGARPSNQEDVVTKKLAVRDSAGKDRIVLSVDGDVPTIKMYNIDGRLAFMLAETPHGDVSMALFDVRRDTETAKPSASGCSSQLSSHELQFLTDFGKHIDTIPKK